MFKKLIFVGAGGLLVLGLLFGRNLIPYTGTAIKKAQSWADSQFDPNFKLDTVRNMLDKIENNIEPLVYQIAQQQVEVERLNREITESEDALARSQAHIMKLRNHLESGDTSFVSTRGQRYSNSQVRTSLETAFKNYKSQKQRLEALHKTLEARQTSLAASQKNLEETNAKRRELIAEADNLEAQIKMLEVAKTASHYNHFDNSELAHVQEMLDDLRSRVETESAMLRMLPELQSGSIPMDEVGEPASDDIIEEVDTYFNGSHEDDVVSK